MDTTIAITLSGHDAEYRLEENAYKALRLYLDRAAERLRDDPDRSDVLLDLERSVGDKLDVLLGSERRLVTAAVMDTVLEQIGAVETGDGGAPTEDAEKTRGRRRLHRIKQGEMLAGVCNGLAAYSEIRVDWVRTLFVGATLLTAGAFVLVYVALMFILPVDATRDAWEAGQR
jgi:phage shock protein C